MQNKKIICADAATENCPCVLAETGDCLICSRLQEKQECSCEWSGVCVYNEFIQNNRKRALTRTGKSFIISDIKTTSDSGFIIMDIACGRGFALSCMSPGAHIFIRPEGCEGYYDTPLSLLHADHVKGLITLCFRVISSKTKVIAGCRIGSRVVIRGPYRNGIKGLPRSLSGKKVMIAASGAGVIPAVAAAGLLSAHNDIELNVHRPGRSEHEIIDRYLDARAGINVKYFNSKNDDINDTSASSIESSAEFTHTNLQNSNFDAYIILGSSIFVNIVAESIRKYVDNYNSKIQNKNVIIAVSNNSVMSCGEGVCGACASGSTHAGGCKCTDVFW